jgi:hypothetical protein
VFTWTPNEDQGGATHSITIRVTDNGSPAQSDSETIDIVVNELNAAPVLAPIGNKEAVEQFMLTFTVTVTDSDSPAQTLTCTLDGTPPAGASITPAGVFTWTPNESQGDTTNFITIRVTDNGSPARSASETIMIRVYEENSFPELAAIGTRPSTKAAR